MLPMSAPRSEAARLPSMTSSSRPGCRSRPRSSSAAPGRAARASRRAARSTGSSRARLTCMSTPVTRSTSGRPATAVQSSCETVLKVRSAEPFWAAMKSAPPVRSIAPAVARRPLGDRAERDDGRDPDGDPDHRQRRSHPLPRDVPQHEREERHPEHSVPQPRPDGIGDSADLRSAKYVPPRSATRLRLLHGLPPGRQPAAVRLRGDPRPDARAAPRRRRRRRPRLRQPRSPLPRPRGREARRGGTQPAQPPLLGLEGDPEPAPRRGHALQAQVRRRSRPRHAGAEHDRRQGRPLAPDVGAARAGRLGARAEPELPDPHPRARSSRARR